MIALRGFQPDTIAMLRQAVAKLRALGRRMAVLLAGLPTSVPGVTVNRLCASGSEAMVQGARALAVFGDSVTTDHISPAGNIADRKSVV